MFCKVVFNILVIFLLIVYWDNSGVSGSSLILLVDSPLYLWTLQLCFPGVGIARFATLFPRSWGCSLALWSHPPLQWILVASSPSSHDKTSKHKRTTSVVASWSFLLGFPFVFPLVPQPSHIHPLFNMERCHSQKIHFFFNIHSQY